MKFKVGDRAICLISPARPEVEVIKLDPFDDRLQYLVRGKALMDYWVSETELEPIKEQTMKFEVGQVWRDRDGDTWQVIYIIEDGEDMFPVKAQRDRDGREDWFTDEGRYSTSCHESEDLRELVSTSPKKTLNFWEAREAALSGKKVKQPENEVTYEKDDFLFRCMEASEINGDWEIVEEPKQYTRYFTIQTGTQTWVAHSTELDAVHWREARSGQPIIAITVDKNGYFVGGKNL
jgi:hypothetical protein